MGLIGIRAAKIPSQIAFKRRSRLVNREAFWGWFFIAPWIIGFMVFTLGPMVASLWLSLTDYELITPPRWIGLKNYINLFTADRLFRLSLYNTTYYVLFSVPLGIIFAFALSLLLNVKLSGMNFFRTVFYLPSVTSGVAVSLLWIWLFNPQFGLINYLLRSIGLPTPGWLVDPKWAKPAFILMSLWGVGSTAVIFLAGLQGVPRGLYEAAEIDGASHWQRFWHITVPMMTPVIFFNLIMGMIGSFQVFTQSYIMTSGGPQDATLFYVLYLFRQGFALLRMGYAAAMAWILFIIILILTLIQLRLADRWVYYEGDMAKR
ncbi:MAG: sugar ABC transporter permease [Anaerolineae bacterium]|nr:sugar ABC transporter permease [Anaerolineae bacterium]MDW8097946.1 sugar ABC transporter permease [Anaerolineae bacterium]